MEELRIKIRSAARRKYQIKEKEMDFEVLEKLIRTAIAREKMERIATVAKKAGISKTSKKDLNQIIKETRQRAKTSR